MADATNEEFMVDFGEVIEVGRGGTDDFNSLKNRPKYNSQTMTGNTNIPKVPAKTSDLTNDSDYQNSTEVDSAINTAIGSLNMPTKTSDLTNDGSDGTSAYVEADELSTVATTGNYNDLTNTPTIPAAQVNSDWNASSGVAEILNKPTIPTVNDATLTITQNGVSKGTFTANDADDTTIEVADTTYSAFTGTDGQTAGVSGLVPAPATTDAGKFLKADGTWDTAGGGGPTVVQTTGTSTTDVMSQNATTSMVYADPATRNKIKIGSGAGATLGDDAIEIGHNSVANNTSSLAVGSNAESRGAYSGAFGNGAQANSQNSVSVGFSAQTASNASYGLAIGSGTVTNHSWSVALGAGARTSAQGEVNVGTGISTTKGYNSSNYRLISGVYDGQTAHDVATVGQINATIDAINTALSTNIPHIGAAS